MFLCAPLPTEYLGTLQPFLSKRLLQIIVTYELPHTRSQLINIVRFDHQCGISTNLREARDIRDNKHARPAHRLYLGYALKGTENAAMSQVRGGMCLPSRRAGKKVITSSSFPSEAPANLYAGVRRRPATIYYTMPGQPRLRVCGKFRETQPLRGREVKEVVSSPKSFFEGWFLFLSQRPRVLGSMPKR